jgi:thioredoxin-related protein
LNQLRHLLLVLLVVPVSFAFADWESTLFPREFQTESSLAKAMVIAKESNKHVIVYATRTNCPPCDVLRSRLRREEVAKPYRDSYVFTAVWNSSMGSTERENYRQKYDVQGAPTWIVFANTGQYVCTARGAFFSDEEGAKLHQAIQTRLTSSEALPTNGPQSCIKS